MRTVFPLHDGYIHEKLHDALTTMAGYSGTVTERIALVYDSQLRKMESSDLDDLRIPESLAKALLKILQRMREAFVQPRGEYSWDLQGIDDYEANEMISRLLVIYGEVCRILPQSYFGPLNSDD